MAPKKDQIVTGHEESNPTTTDESGCSKSLPEVASSGCSTTIVSLSDKELLTIFSRLPLCDLQTLELVSKRFRWITLKVNSDRRCLSLIQTPQYRTQLKDITRYWYFTDYSARFPFGDDCYLVTREINLKAIQWFGERFPNVTQLNLYCIDHLSVDRFVQLIQLYPTLERLILHSTDAQQAEYNQAQFWASLYSLRDTLRHLHLPFNAQYHVAAAQLSPLMTTTLNSFYHQTDMDFGGTILETGEENVMYKLEQYGLLLHTELYEMLWLKKLIIGDPPMDNSTFRFGLYVPLEGRHPIIGLHVINRMLESRNSPESLTHLDLAIPSNIDVLSVLPTLSRFTHLTHIRLTERHSAQSPSMFFSQLTKQNYRTKLGQPNRTQLPSVCQLNIYQFAITPSTGIFRYLPIIFPQVHTLCFEDCQMVTKSTSKTCPNSFPIWLLSSVRRFGHLNRLYHNQRLVLWLDREKDGDKAEKDRCVQMFVKQVLECKSQI